MTTKTTKTPRRAKTTKSTAQETTTKTTATKKVAPKKVATSTTTSTDKLKALEEKLNKTEERLNTLINVLHTEMKNHLERGPEGLASKIRKNDLLE